MTVTLIVRPAAVVLAVFLALLLSSCANSPVTRFYTLTSLQAPADPTKEQGVKSLIVVGVGPTGIADYLDRPQVAVRTGENEVQFNEFERWAGPLNEEINRTVVENLSALLGPRGIHVTSWKTALPGRIIVGLSVTRFEATAHGTVAFRATWGLGKDTDKTARLIRESVLTKPIGREGYGAIAAAMSALLLDFSREVAAAIEETVKAGDTSPVDGR